MNTYLKIALKIIAAIAVLCGLVVGCFTISQKMKRDKIEKEVESVNKTCDTIKYVNENPEINFSNFPESTMTKVQYQVLRNGKIMRDTTISNFSYVSEEGRFRSMNIPFKGFLRSDTIVVSVGPQMKFYVSKFNYSANALYGMMGPVAVSKCGLEPNFTINGTEHTQVLSPDRALLNNRMEDQIKFITYGTPEYKTRVQQLKITEKQAEAIYLKNKVNQQSGVGRLPDLHIEAGDTYYFFVEDVNDGKTQLSYRINAKTGAIKKYNNYPNE